MADILGWLGATLVLGAYALVSLRKLPPSSLLWAGMNVVGAATLATSALIDARWPFVVLNVVWLCIGLWGIIHPPKEVTPDRLDPPQPTAH